MGSRISMGNSVLALTTLLGLLGHSELWATEKREEGVAQRGGDAILTDEKHLSLGPANWTDWPPQCPARVVHQRG